MIPRIITEDSILARLPSGLDAAQRNWLEGIRYSIEIVDLAYRRLCCVLHELGGTSEGSPLDSPSNISVAHDVYASVLLDAWTVIDATWRLKRFLLDSRLPHPPGPPVPPPEDAVPQAIRAENFAKAVRPLKQLRDGFQHLDNKVANAAAIRQPIWGYIQWIKLFPTTGRLHTCCLVPGVPGLGTSEFNLLNPLGKAFRATVDHVTLTAFQTAADLSHLHTLARDLAGQLDDVLRPHLAGLPHGGDSFVILMALETAGSPGSPGSDSSVHSPVEPPPSALEPSPAEDP